MSRELPKLPPGLSPERIKAAVNPQPRCPTVIIADRSGSMEGKPIVELQEALHQFFCTLAEDPACQASVEPAIVTCGGEARLETPFISLLEFDRSQLLLLEAEGDTPLGSALSIALDAVLEQRDKYRRSGLPSYKPVVVALSDGQPTDALQEIAERYRALEGEVLLIVVGIGPHADMALLGQIAQPSIPALRLADCDFRKLFRLLSDSFRKLGGSCRATDAFLPLRELSR
jgi:uncharacterized protein YegL